MASTVADRQLAPEQAPRKGWIDHWDPEDPAFWEGTGRSVARRNLVFSILAEHLGFSVWVLWSIVAVNLNSVGFAFTESQLFWLVAVPNLVGATLRLPYTFAVPKFGGRNWTIVSALLLAGPVARAGLGGEQPGHVASARCSLVAALAGFGGGNFASSMTNISWFYPEQEKGWALGLNAAGGNIGVAVVQAPFVVSAVITAGAGIHLGRAGLMWVPLALLAAFCAWRFMDNLTRRARPTSPPARPPRKRPHTWVMSFLYIGTFGSFIGYAAAFPLLIKGQFPDVNVTAYAFLGALVGSLVRPFGGWLVRPGRRRPGHRGAASWRWALGVLGVVRRAEPGQLRAVPRLLHAAVRGDRRRQRLDVPDDPGDLPPRRRPDRPGRGARPAQAAAAIGIISAIGAYGGFLVPRTYGWSTAAFGSIVPRSTSTSACTP